MSAPLGSCAGFDRVRGLPEPLDATHESPRLLAVGANADDVSLLAQRALVSRDDPQAIDAIPWRESAVVEKDLSEQHEIVVFAE